MADIFKVDLSSIDMSSKVLSVLGLTQKFNHGQLSKYNAFVENFPQFFKDLDGNAVKIEEKRFTHDFSESPGYVEPIIEEINEVKEELVIEEVTPVVEEVVIDEIPEVVEEVVIDEVPVVEEVVEVVEEPVSTIKAFEDFASKNEIQAYADTFNVQLNKNKSMKVMYSDLLKALEK